MSWRNRRSDRRRDDRQTHPGRALRETGEAEADDEDYEVERAQSASPTSALHSTACSRSLGT